MLWLQTNKTGSGTMNLGGSLTRQVGCCSKQKYLMMMMVVCKSDCISSFSQMEKDETVGESSPHIANIGRLVEVSVA